MKHKLKNKFICKPYEELGDKILFYDLETDSLYAPYANIKSAFVQYGQGEPELVKTKAEWKLFEERLASSDWLKVDFNGINYDRIVLQRNGIKFNEINSHDVFQIFKNTNPISPGYSQKFLAFYYLGDPHLAEGEVVKYCGKHRCELHDVPEEILHAYNAHDVKQLSQLFALIWDIVIRPEFWFSYLDDILVGRPVHEMILKGGLYLDRKQIVKNLQKLQKKISRLNDLAIYESDGEVLNINSPKQLGKYLSMYENIELKLTSNGEFAVGKSVLNDIKSESKIAQIAYDIRKATKAKSYYENMLSALNDPTFEKTQTQNWIPTQFSVSNARTRRFTSSSKHKLNFQNQTEETTQVQIVPQDELFVKIDLSQIENIVHIFFSNDVERRRAYERDPEWSEYVWLANRILGTNLTKDELDAIPSKQVPHWSEYKLYKSGKLGMNFGMGVDLFAEMFALSPSIAHETFEEIHLACPAIRYLQEKVKAELLRVGYVTDPFGKRYTGPPRLAYKVVAYMVQGCGTGSLPKAMLRSLYDAIHSARKQLKQNVGVMQATTHDDFQMRLKLNLGVENILQLLQKFKYITTKKFSPLFDNIPIRSKLYLSRTNVAEATEIKELTIENIKPYVES